MRWYLFFKGNFRYNGETFTYDANGNTTTRLDACGTTTYTWDSENRLTGISGFRPDCSTLSASYKYDALGRRIEKNVDGTATKYLYDEQDILAEYDGNNQLLTRYVHGKGIDEPISLTKNGQTYFYHTDALGSVIAITDSAGNVVQRYEYDSFGNIISMSDPDFIQPYTYTSREYDPESGLYFYRARYYDDKVGRFISEDPILKPGNPNAPFMLRYLLKTPASLHAYGYAKNNPLRYTDPTGTLSCEGCNLTCDLICHGIHFAGCLLICGGNPACELACEFVIGSADCMLACHSICFKNCEKKDKCYGASGSW